MLTHADEKSLGWDVLDGLGHTGAKRAYDFVRDENAVLKVFALPVQPVTVKNGVQAAVSIDGGPLTVLDFFAAEFSESWRRHVLINSAVAVVHGLKLKPRAYGPIPETRLERTAP
jgi:hypothetical protein